MADLRPTIVDGVARTWTAASEVRVNGGKGAETMTALFLDLSEAANAKCNGALLKVTVEELLQLDKREKHYERIVVQAEWDGTVVPAWTYAVPMARKTRQGVVLEGYVALIEEALRSYSVEFNTMFWKSTEPFRTPLVAGTYSFVDPQQNRASGRA